eukprot:TRINITY_DN39750_c0_g1_i2.p2 TRINITY_DN39750_c0_g1~~TRINITY_DN39750_c0_g1_i2.p2  ORF type:complete len:121 (+),score=16.36 TRINITY_DN39750_c0_g1_i2:322-684(+)
MKANAEYEDQLPRSLGALHLKHSILLAKLCSLQPNLVHIQSPDFHDERPLPPNPKEPLDRGPSLSKLPADSSLKAPHLKQLERLAKLWVPQLLAEQYQSPGRTSDPTNPNDDPPVPPKLP